MVPGMLDRTREVRGVAVPSFFYGTAWKEDRTEALAAEAVAAGFRAIDTANQRRHYLEAAVGKAIAGRRDELFLQTKFTYARGQDHRIPYDPSAPFAQQVEQSFASSLEHLGASAIDSYVLHGPASGHGLDDADVEVWRAMEAICDRGAARLLGVSNVSLEQLAALCRVARVQPAFVQNRCFARTGWDGEVRAFCRDHGMAYQGFSLLTANGHVLEAEPVARACARTRKSPAQVIFRFALEVGMIPLTGTSSPAHMREDLAAFDFALEPSEVRAIERAALRG